MVGMEIPFVSVYHAAICLENKSRIRALRFLPSCRHKTNTLGWRQKVTGLEIYLFGRPQSHGLELIWRSHSGGCLNEGTFSQVIYSYSFKLELTTNPTTRRTSSKFQLPSQDFLSSQHCTTPHVPHPPTSRSSLPSSPFQVYPFQH